MTKKHFEHAASMVRAIIAGDWTNDSPVVTVDGLPYHPDLEHSDSTRAAQTAEAFVILFRAFNPRFDERRFYRACGIEVRA